MTFNPRLKLFTSTTDIHYYKLFISLSLLLLLLMSISAINDFSWKWLPWIICMKCTLVIISINSSDDRSVRYLQTPTISADYENKPEKLFHLHRECLLICLDSEWCTIHTRTECQYLHLNKNFCSILAFCT